MAETIYLAPFREYHKKSGDTKFCEGVDCKRDLPLSDFPKTGGRYCKKCASKRLNDKHKARKAERDMFFL